MFNILLYRHLLKQVPTLIPVHRPRTPSPARQIRKVHLPKPLSSMKRNSNTDSFEPNVHELNPSQVIFLLFKFILYYIYANIYDYIFINTYVWYLFILIYIFYYKKNVNKSIVIT